MKDNSGIQCKIGFGARKRSKSNHARKFGNNQDEEFQFRKFGRKWLNLNLWIIKIKFHLILNY